MITVVDRARLHLATGSAVYRRWEQRTGARITGWSVRRRWATFVLLPTLLFCCGGTVLGVPAAWIARETIDASRGAPSPDAAADSYLMALGYNNEDGLLAILDNDHQGKLLAQWRTYRAAMDSTSPPPSRLDFSSLAVGPVSDHRAEVTADVSATWWRTGDRVGGYGSEAFTWRFKTREDNGWQVSAVEPPEWCGGYVRLDACKR